MDKAIFSSFGLRENPFGVNPDPRHLFLTRQTQTTLNALIQGVQSRQGLILLTGDVGTGKTTLINSLLDWLQRNGVPTAFIFNSHLETQESFELMLADFHIASDARSTSSAVSKLNAWLLERDRAGETAVLIVDEAQGLPSHTIEEIRLLLNLETPKAKLLQIVLSGQSSLNDRLKRLDLRPVHQRISLRCKTLPMTLEETRGCIQHRLRVAGAQDDSLFTPEALDTAHFYSRGIPRIINLLCEQALFKSYYGGVRPVSAGMIEDASREFQFDGDRPIAPPLKVDEGLRTRANLIPMQAILTNSPIAFAAAAGSDSNRLPEAKTTHFQVPPIKLPLVLPSHNRPADPHTVKSVPSLNDTFAPQSHETTTRAISSPHRSADVNEIIAGLSAGRATSPPVRINSPWAKKRSSLATASIRKLISSLAGGKSALLAFIVNGKAPLARLSRDAYFSLQSDYHLWSKRCLAAVSPAIRSVASPVISWLKEPRSPKLMARANSKMRDEPSGRFSAVSSNLRDKAQPILRWLQTPLRPAHRR